MGKKINIRPTTGVYATYKNINYQIWTAIAEFVDNSTQSYISNRSILKETKYWDGLNVEINYKKDDNGEYYLEIKDNAFGMDFHDFQRAIVLDSKPTSISRSEFGMGLKTAACWFGLKWSVESTALGNPVKYKAEVDVEALSKYKNEEILVDEIPCHPKEHGSIIKIWNMNRSIIGRSIGKTKLMIAAMYRVDLRSGDINIFYNDEKLSFEEYEIYSEILPDGTKKLFKKEINFEIENNGKIYCVRGFQGIRKVANVSAAGFTLIRRGRVIVGGADNNYRPKDIFGDSNSFVYQRFFGELHMDDWPVVQTKDNFDWNNGLEDKLVDKLKLECAEYIKKAKIIRVRKKTSVTDVIKKVAERFEKTGVIREVSISDYQESMTMQHEINPQTSLFEENEFGVENDNEVLFEGGDAKSIYFKIGRIEYKFNLVLDRSDPEAQWLKIIELKGEYTIKWNVKHVFFKKFMENPDFVLAMQEFIFAFAISEIESKKYGENRLIESYSIRNKMNDILKAIGEGGV